MLIKILGFFSIRLAIFYGNHVSGQHVDASWLRNNGYGR